MSDVARAAEMLAAMDELSRSMGMHVDATPHGLVLRSNETGRMVAALWVKWDGEKYEPASNE